MDDAGCREAPGLESVRRRLDMSVLQRAFRVISALAIVGAIDLSITARVLATSGGSIEPLQVVTIVLSIVMSLALGIAGLAASGRPDAIHRLFLAIALAIWANMCNVFLLVLEGEFIFSVAINAVIVIAYAYLAHRVRRDSRSSL